MEKITLIFSRTSVTSDAFSTSIFFIGELVAGDALHGIFQMNRAFMIQEVHYAGELIFWTNYLYPFHLLEHMPSSFHQMHKDRNVWQ